MGGGQLTRYHLSVQFSSHRFSCPTAEVQLREMPRWVVVCRIPNVTKAGGMSKAPRLTCDSQAAAAAWGRVDTQERQWHPRKDTSKQGQPRQAQFRSAAGSATALLGNSG